MKKFLSIHTCNLQLLSATIPVHPFYPSFRTELSLELGKERSHKKYSRDQLARLRHKTSFIHGYFYCMRPKVSYESCNCRIYHISPFFFSLYPLHSTPKLPAQRIIPCFLMEKYQDRAFSTLPSVTRLYLFFSFLCSVISDLWKKGTPKVWEWKKCVCHGSTCFRSHYSILRSIWTEEGKRGWTQMSIPNRNRLAKSNKKNNRKRCH